MYALVSGFSDAGNNISGTGQAHTVYGASKETGKAQAGRMRSTGTVRYWLDNARSGRAPQSYVGMVG